VGNCAFAGLELILKDNLSQEGFYTYLNVSARHAHAELPKLIKELDPEKESATIAKAKEVSKILRGEQKKWDYQELKRERFSKIDENWTKFMWAGIALTSAVALGIFFLFYAL
jgi:hypothetical protein